MGPVIQDQSDETSTSAPFLPEGTSGEQFCPGLSLEITYTLQTECQDGTPVRGCHSVFEWQQIVLK